MNHNYNSENSKVCQLKIQLTGFTTAYLSYGTTTVLKYWRQTFIRLVSDNARGLAGASVESVGCREGIDSTTGVGRLNAVVQF